MSSALCEKILQTFLVTAFPPCSQLLSALATFNAACNAALARGPHLATIGSGCEQLRPFLTFQMTAFPNVSFNCKPQASGLKKKVVFSLTWSTSEEGVVPGSPMVATKLPTATFSSRAMRPGGTAEPAPVWDALSYGNNYLEFSRITWSFFGDASCFCWYFCSCLVEYVSHHLMTSWPRRWSPLFTKRPTSLFTHLFLFWNILLGIYSFHLNTAFGKNNQALGQLCLCHFPNVPLMKS